MGNCFTETAIDALVNQTRAEPPAASVGREAGTIGESFLKVLRHPTEVLIRGWNWKSALFSSLCRGAIFFFANLMAGLEAATGAMIGEFAYRAVTAGFYGAVTQSFRAAEPRWMATIVVLLGVPAVSHAVEFAVHWMRGTRNLRASIVASVCFTMLSTLFNLYAMRRGVLVVGSGGGSLGDDLRSLPKTIRSFVGSGFGLLPS